MEGDDVVNEQSIEAAGANANAEAPEEGHTALLIEEPEAEQPEKEGNDPDLSPSANHYVRIPEPAPDRKPPAWFPAKMIPKGMRFPKGIDVTFVRIRGTLTSAKHLGDRYAIVWELSDGDEKLAYGRSMSDVNRAAGELAKQMVRVIDGHAVSWDGLPGTANVDQFWNEIGAKGRSQLQRLYTQLHVYDRSEQEDFFENCIGLVRTG